MCCTALQCFSVCCSMLQCVANTPGSHTVKHKQQMYVHSMPRGVAELCMMLQGHCCSVLQCAEVYCSALQCFVVCGSGSVAVCCNALKYVEVWQFAAVYCSVLHFAAFCYIVLLLVGNATTNGCETQTSIFLHLSLNRFRVFRLSDLPEILSCYTHTDTHAYTHIHTHTHTHAHTHTCSHTHTDARPISHTHVHNTSYT